MVRRVRLQHLLKMPCRFLTPVESLQRRGDTENGPQIAPGLRNILQVCLGVFEHGNGGDMLTFVQSRSKHLQSLMRIRLLIRNVKQPLQRTSGSFRRLPDGSAGAAFCRAAAFSFPLA
jgi:hypothetical protein